MLILDFLKTKHGVPSCLMPFHVDESFIHPTKKRFLIIADWSDSKVIGSFFIEHSKIQIENEW